MQRVGVRRYVEGFVSKTVIYVYPRVKTLPGGVKGMWNIAIFFFSVSGSGHLPKTTWEDERLQTPFLLHAELYDVSVCSLCLSLAIPQ